MKKNIGEAGAVTQFRIVLVGQVISLFGNAALRFAMPLYLLRETGSAALFGLVSAAALIPQIICTLLGGVLADRLPKGQIMAGLDLLTALLAAGAAGALGQIPPALLAGTVLAALYAIQGIYQPTVQASLPALLREEQLVRGNAMVNMVNTVDELIGPALGGLLFALWGPRLLLALCAVCFALSACLELRLHIPAAVPEKAMGGMRQGIAYLCARPVLFQVSAVLAFFNLVLSAAWGIGIPLLVVQVLGCSDAELGLTQGALGLGGLLGGVLAGTLAAKIRLRHGTACMLVCSAVSVGMAGAVLPGMPAQMGYWLITLLGMLAMAAATVFTVQLCSAVQNIAPAALVGRVMAVVLVLVTCTQPLGQAVYGVAYEYLPPYWVLLGAAALSLVIVPSSTPLLIRLESELAISDGLRYSE